MAQSFAVGPAVNLTLGALAPARLQYASGLFNLMRNLGGAIGIAVCATILNDRTNLPLFTVGRTLEQQQSGLDRFAAAIGCRRVASGTLERVVGADIAPGADRKFRRRLPHHHGLFHRGHRARAADEKGDGACGAAHRGPLGGITVGRRTRPPSARFSARVFRRVRGRVRRHAHLR